MNSAINKYLSEPTRVRFHGLQLNDLASLVAGVKSVVYTSMYDGEDEKNIDALCSDLKLRKIVLAEKEDTLGKKCADILIGTNINKLKTAAKHYTNTASMGWGIALDYPECCVKAYINWRGMRERKDLISHIYDNSPKNRLIPFYVNNVFNFFSRVGFNNKEKPIDAGNYAAFVKLNENFDRESFIPWHPCSFFCKETMAKGRKIYEVMAKHIPHITRFRQSVLSKPIIFWDKFLFAVLNGNCRKKDKNFTVDYKGISQPRSLISAETEKILTCHNTIQVSASGKISRPGSMPVPANYVFIPFSS